jgi:uncharacterized circularly permuted ATP-grasp superfamily protein
MVNALGSGILETRALLAFMPRSAANALFGEDLKLPEIATWWCGQQSRARPVWPPTSTKMVIGPAYARACPSSTTTANPCSARRSMPPEQGLIGEWLRPMAPICRPGSR